MNAESARHEVEGTARQLSLDRPHPQLHPLGGQPVSGHAQHGLADVEADECRLRVALQQELGRGARPRAQLEDAPRAVSAGRDELALELVVGGDVGAYLLLVGAGIEVKLPAEDALKLHLPHRALATDEPGAVLVVAPQVAGRPVGTEVLARSAASAIGVDANPEAHRHARLRDGVLRRLSPAVGREIDSSEPCRGERMTASAFDC